jgi:hypothetical protein
VDAPIRGVALLRAGVGAALTVFPGRVASAAEGRPATPLARVFTRVLGVRHLTQATLTLTLTAPQLLTPLCGAVVDGLHAATVMVLAAVSPRYRRAALVNAALAATFCGLGIVRHEFTDLDEIFIEPVPRTDPALRARVGNRYGSVLDNLRHSAAPPAP